MEFLKQVLGEELYTQLSAAVDAYNAKAENKDKQVKLVNLAEGGYVSKDKHVALETELGSLRAQHKESESLIEQLKEGNKDNESLQTKVTEYEKQIQQLQGQLTEQKTDAAMDRALAAAGANAGDIDYLKFQWRKKGDIVLDEHGEVKGADDAVSALKTQCPGQFATEKSPLKIDPQKLPTGDDRKAEPKTLAEAIEMKYESEK